MIYFFRNFYFDRTEEEIIKNTELLINSISQAFVNNNLELISKNLELISQLNSGQSWLIDREGYLLFSYPTALANREKRIRFADIDLIMKGKVISKRIESPYFERPMLLIGLPLYSPRGGDISGGFLLFTSVAGINSTIGQVKLMMLYSSLLAIFLAILISYLWSKSLTAPLKRMSSIAIELSNGNLGKKVEIEDGTEIGTLAHSMNHLSQELKLTIDNLVQERNKLKYVLSGMEEGVLVIDPDYNLILWNNSVKRLFNLKQDKSSYEFEEVITDEEIRELFKNSLEEDSSYKKEFTITYANKKKRLIVYCNPIYIEGDRLLGIVGLFQDISERWRFEELQRDFVANVSHELKTPLSSIKGSAEVLLDKIIASEERRDDYLRIILEESDRLTHLVNEILDLAELDASSLEFNLEKTDARQLLDDIELIFNKSLGDKRTLKVKKDNSKEIHILANSEKIKQVFLNLLDNACKFSKEDSSIELGISEEGDKVKFWVKDFGVGIEEDKLENIWERFFKVDKARTPGDAKGSGLGLAIVKGIVEAHNGKVFVKSELGKGSVFSFYLQKYDE